MSDLKLSLKEHLRHLKTTNTPTLVVEGKDDIIVCRKIFNKFRLPESNIRVAGDCHMLKELYLEFKKNPNNFPYVKLFLADADMAVITGVHADYWGIFYTSGYSIENDVLTDAKDFLDALLLDDDYYHKKSSLLNSLCEWFAFESEDYQNDYDEKIGSSTKNTNFETCSLKNTSVFSQKEWKLEPLFLQKRNFKTPCPKFLELIEMSPFKYIRGHTLMMAFSILSATANRSNAQYTTIYKGTPNDKNIFSGTEYEYTESKLLDTCLSHVLALPNQGNDCVKRLIDKFIEKFS